MKYKAFISYRHSPQSRLHAERLESALKRYAKPIFLPPLSIFRDERVLLPGDDLPKKLRLALQNSEFLLYIASKEAAQSEWIRDELRIWCKELGRGDRLLVVHISDQIAIDREANSVIWSRTDAIPREVEPYLRHIPLWTDLTWVTREEQLDLSNADFKKQINAIVARFRGLEPGQMNDAEVLTHRRNIRLRNTGIGAIVILSALALYFGYSARQSAVREVEAITEANTAEKLREQEASRRAEQERRAQAQQEIAKRTGYFNSIRLVDEARRMGLLPRMRNILATVEPEMRGWEWYRLSFVSERGRPLGGDFQSAENVAISPQGNWMAAQGVRDGPNLLVWQRQRTPTVGHRIHSAARTDVLRFSDDEKRLLQGSYAPGQQILERLSVFETKTGKQILEVAARNSANGFILATDSQLTVAAAFEPDDLRSSGLLTLWNLVSGEMVGSLRLPPDVQSLFVSDDGSHIVTVTRGTPETNFWLQRFTTRPFLPESAPVLMRARLPVSAFPDTTRIIGVDDQGHLTLWESLTGTALRLRSDVVQLGQAVFSPSGRWAVTYKKALSEPGWTPGETVLVFSRDGKQLVELPWDKRSILRGSPGFNGAPFEGIQMDSTGQFLMVPRENDAAAHLPPQLLVYGAERGQLIVKLDGEIDTGWSLRADFFSDERLLATSNRNEMVVYDLSTGLLLTTLLGSAPGQANFVSDLRGARDGRYAISSDRSGRVFLWEIGREQNQASVFGTDVVIEDLSWNRSGMELVVGGAGLKNVGTVEVWDATTETRKRTFSAERLGVHGLATVSGHPWIVLHDEFDGMSLWDFKAGKMVRALPLGREISKPVQLPNDPAHSSFSPYSRGFSSVDCSVDGSKCAASGLIDGAIRIWQPEEDAIPEVWQVFASSATAVALQRDGSGVVAGSASGQIVAAELPSMRIKWRVQVEGGSVTSLAADARGWIAAGFNDGRLALISASGGQIKHLINAHLQTVSSLDFEPTQGSRLASGSLDGSVKIWDCELGIEALTLDQPSPVTALRFHPNGRMLASGSTDRFVRIWKTLL